MNYLLRITLDRKTGWLDVSRQSSAATGNMGGSPPKSMPLESAPDD